MLTIVTLMGCRSSQKYAGPEAIQQNQETITLSGWGSTPSENQLLQKILRRFEAKHPEITVKFEAIPDQYMNVLKTRLIGETAADVFFLDALEAPLLIQSGVLEPLNSYIQPDFQLADFNPVLLKAFQQQGVIYGLPKDFSTLVLFYNPTALKVVGLTAPPKTWEELRAFAKKLTRDRNQDGKVDQYGLGIAPELARQLFLIKAFGGQLVDKKGYATFATPQALQGLAWVIAQYRQDRTTVQPSDVGANSGLELFGQEKVAMVLEGAWAIPYLQETFPQLKFATAEVPTMGGRKGTMAYTVAYVMNKKSKRKAAAWKLIAYLTGKEGMKAWTSQGLALPTRQSLLTEMGYAQNPLYAAFVVGADYATIWQSGENLPTIRDHFNNQFVSALLGEQSLSAAMQKAQDAANREIYLAN